MRGQAVSERLRTWVPAALGPGASPPAPRGTGMCRRAPSPATDRRRPSLVLARVRDSAPLPSSQGGPGTPVSERSRLCPRCSPPSHRPGTPSCPPRDCTAPGRSRPEVLARPLFWEPLPPILTLPGSLHPTSSARLILTSCFPCLGREIARWVFPSLPA